MTLVSISIPTYNRSAGLLSLIESIFSQTYQDFHIFIYDNCSTGIHHDVINQISKMPQVTLYRNLENIGPIKNIRNAIENNVAKYNLVLADDMLLSPNYLKQTLEIMEANDDAMLVYTGSHQIYPHIQINHIDSYCLTQDSFKERLMSLASNITYGTAVYSLYRTATIRTLGDFWPTSRFVRFGDYALLSMILSYGKIYQVEECLITRRLDINETHINIRLEKSFHGDLEYLSMPMTHGVFFHFKYLKSQALRLGLDDFFIRSVCSTLLGNRKDEFIHELQRAKRLIRKGEFFHTWSDYNAQPLIDKKYVIQELLSCFSFLSYLNKEKTFTSTEQLLIDMLKA